MTEEADFGKILCFSNCAFNIRKSYKISGWKALYFRSYQSKTSYGFKTPPSAFRVDKYWAIIVQIQCLKLFNDYKVNAHQKYTPTTPQTGSEIH